MITVVRSSGGVGSSLYSAGLNARLGRQNHQYFDARILTDGEKLRTVIPTMVGRCVYTAQEQPGGRDRIQDDLFKKVATAEGLLGRLPYTILAKLFHLVGWKRFETNKPLHLEPLEHAAFEALLPDNGDTAFVDDVPVMKNEAEAMMSYQRQRAANVAGGQCQQSSSSHE
jgi:hypothetical protein